MVGWIILGIYIIGILLSAIIFPRAFPLEEDWVIRDGEAYPIDEEIYKIHICEMSTIWPLVVVLIPLKLFTMFTDWCYEKFRKK